MWLFLLSCFETCSSSILVEILCLVFIQILLLMLLLKLDDVFIARHEVELGGLLLSNLIDSPDLAYVHNY